MTLIERLELSTASIESSGPGEWDRIERILAERALLCAQVHTCGLADLERLRAVWERGQLVEQRLRENADALRGEVGECNRSSAHLRRVSHYR